MKGSRAPIEPLAGADIGVLLGSGLGDVSDGYPVEAVLPFSAIDGLGDTRVSGHRGVIKCARVGQCRCLFIEGRRHTYEIDARAPADNIRALIAFVAETGLRKLVITSASGSLDSSLPPGRLVLVRDIIDLQMRRPQSGDYDDQRRGLPLDAALGRDIEAAARAAGVPLGRGVMACNAGPTYETAAEVAALQRLGASVVTMSGAPEIAQCRDFGIRVASLALVTNWATGISRSPLDHAEVLAAAGGAAGSLKRLVERFVYNTMS